MDLAEIGLQDNMFFNFLRLHSVSSIKGLAMIVYVMVILENERQ